MATTLNLNTAENLNITVRRGDSMSFEITVKDSDGDAVDLTNYNFDMDVRSRSSINSSSGRNDIVLSNLPGGRNKLLLSLSGSADGTLSISAPSDAMANILPGSYFFDISASHKTNSTVETWFYGKLNVKADITLR